MRKLLVLFLCVGLLAAFAFGCGQEKTDKGDETSAAGTPEEVMDSTRMDSAMVDTAAAMEEAEPAGDSM